MSKLIILRGNSGSGKTTIAKELQKHFGRNTMLISQDVIRRDMLWVKDGESTEAIPLMKELLAYGIKHSDIVILEGIMYADWYKPLFELAIRLYGTEVYAYYFDLPFEEASDETKLQRIWRRSNAQMVEGKGFFGCVKGKNYYIGKGNLGYCNRNLRGRYELLKYRGNIPVEGKKHRILCASMIK